MWASETQKGFCNDSADILHNTEAVLQALQLIDETSFHSRVNKVKVQNFRRATKRLLKIVLPSDERRRRPLIKSCLLGWCQLRIRIYEVM